MTSVRPKLKPETPKSVTAWETATGRTVWMKADGSWTEDVTRLGVFTGEEAEARLAAAAREEGRVTDPYFMEVTEDGLVKDMVGRALESFALKTAANPHHSKANVTPKCVMASPVRVHRLHS